MGSTTRLLVLGLAAVLFAESAVAAGGKEKVVYSFQGGNDGTYPAGGVVFDQTGNLYGATGWDDSTGIGTVFQLTKQNGIWKNNLLYTFHGSDGSIPTGGVVLDKSGNIYGGTAYGGTGHCILLGSDVGCGLVYEISPPARVGAAWTETVIYSFQGGKDGYFPQGDLVFDNAGNLYGATQFGGGFGSCDPFYPFCGTIFGLSPPKKKGGKWTEKVLYSFKNKKDGADPNGGLVLDKNGALYGTTFCGGDAECQNLQKGDGVVFRLKPPAMRGGDWTYKVLYSFKGYPGDGTEPNGGLIFEAQGTLYGTTKGGGSHGGGTAYKLRRVATKNPLWQEKVLHQFGSGNDAIYPVGGLVFDPAGNLYGDAPGGINAKGAVYRLQPPLKKAGHWRYAILYNLKDLPDGYTPWSKLTLDSSGNLYSTTISGGNGPCQQGCGTVFEVWP